MTVSITDARVEIHRSEPTERAELTPSDNGDRTCTILDDAGEYMYAIAHVPNETASGSLAHDAHTASATFTTTDPFTFSHTPSGTPGGVVVFVFDSDGSNIAGAITEVTYGGVRMFPGGGGGGGTISATWYTLYAGVPSGTQTVSIDHDGSANVKQAVCVTFVTGRNVQNALKELAAQVVVRTGGANDPVGNLYSSRGALRYCAIMSDEDDTSAHTPLSDQTEVVSADFGTEVFRVYRRTSVETGTHPVGFEYTGSSGNAVFIAFAIEEIPFDTKLEIYNLTNLSSPTLSGTVSALDDLVSNRAKHAMAMDSTGDYLYIAGSAGAMYTLDISTRTSPTLQDTQTAVGNYAGDYSGAYLEQLGRFSQNYSHMVHRVGSQVFRASPNAASFGGAEITRFDITTPQSPSLTQTLSIDVVPTDTTYEPMRSGVGYVTPDSNFIYYLSTTGITIVDIVGTMTEAATVTVPTAGSGGPQIQALELTFLPNPSALTNRFVTILCRYRDTDTFGIYSAAYNYLWMTYQTASANEWDNLSLYSHDESVGVVDPVLISTSRLASGSSAGRLSAAEPPDHATIVRAERGEDYLYVFYRTGGSAKTTPPVGTGFTREPSSQGRITVWEFTNLGLSVDSSVGRTTPRLLTSMEPYSLHDFGQLHLTSSVLVGIGGNRGLDDRSLVTLDIPTGWVELDEVLHVPGISFDSGIDGVGPSDRLSGTSTMSFTLDNSGRETASDLGQYSPDHANLFSGFRIGREIRFAVDWDSSTYYPFWGTIDTIAADTGIYGTRKTKVVCLDYMDYLGRALSRGLVTRFDESAAQATHLLLNYAQSDPVGVYFLNVSGEYDTYPIIFDDTKDDTPIAIELQKIVQTDRSYIYVVGGVLYYEGRGVRASAIDGTADLTLTDAEILKLLPDHSAENLINEVEAKVFPREFDSAAVVLFKYENTQEISAGETVTFTATYSDPDQKAARVGGFDMVAPVATTDYTFNKNESGSGTDRTYQLDVSVEFFGNSADVSITNRGPKDGYLTSFKFRGKGIYTYEPVRVRKENRQSKAQYGPLPVTYDLPYHNLTTIAEDTAQYLIWKYSTPATFARSVTVWANQNSTLMDFIVKTRMIGSLVDLSETLSGLSSAKYFIQSTIVTYQFGSDRVFATFGLVPADKESIFEFGDGVGSGSSFDGEDVFGSSFVI